MVLIVLDGTDIEGSIPQSYLSKLSGGDYEIFIVINKMDCIPEAISRERFKGWIASRIHELMPEISVVNLEAHKDNKHLALCSSKETIGLKKLVSSLKELKVSEQRKYIHTIGVTNVGKSSILNSLRVASKKCNSSP